MEPRSTRHPKQPNKKKGLLFVYFAVPALVLILAIALWQMKDLNNLFGGGGKDGDKSTLSAGQASIPPSPKPTATVQPSSSGGPSPTAETASTPQPPRATQGENGKAVTMTFVGDVMMSDKVEGLLQKNGYDYPYTFVKSYFQQADLSVANLETPVTEAGTKQAKQYSYQSSPLALPPMAEAGIDLVNLANNHSMDRGAEGLLDTISQLDKNGILHVGGGANIDEAYKPAIVEKNGMKIAFFGFSHIVPDASWKAAKNQAGLTQIYDPTLAVDSIKKARPDVDLVVVITHWGNERQDHIEPYQRTLAEKFIDAGADLIIGGHPHVLQGFEQYKGKWIAYSLGNFIFTTNTFTKTWDSMILQATCKKDSGCDLNVVPVLTTYAKPEPMKEPKAGQLLNHLTQISYGAKVDSNGRVTAVKP